MSLPALVDLVRGFHGMIRTLPEIMRVAAEARALEPPLEAGTWREKQMTFEGAGFRGKILIREGRGAYSGPVMEPERMQMIDIEPVSGRLSEMPLKALPAPKKDPEIAFDLFNPPKRRWKRPV